MTEDPIKQTPPNRTRDPQDIVLTGARLRIVLVRPTHPGNIGATARAMSNMGLKDLVLVAPREFPSPVATARASGAENLLDQARVVATVDEALSDVQYVIGTTARHRSIQWPVQTPADAMHGALTRLANENVAVLFGPERSGLSNADVDRCHALVRIPVDEAYPSLNLASAVLVLAYELRVSELGMTLRRQSSAPQLATADPGAGLATQGRQSPLATGEQLQGFYAHWEHVLDRIEFLKSKPPTKLIRKFVRIFNRTHLTSEEINILRGVLTTIEHRLDETGPDRR